MGDTPNAWPNVVAENSAVNSNCIYPKSNHGSIQFEQGYCSRMPPSIETTMPVENEPRSVENGSSKTTVGIIYPPPEVRNIVDKTAVFVARNGLEFEARIHKNEQSNPKFNFLKPGDPYHAYYQYRVKEMKEGKPGDAPVAPAMNASAPPPPAKPQLAAAPVNVPAPSAQHLKQQEILKQFHQDIPQIPKEPPPDFEFIVDPPSISAMELDIVKLTAQFVARNGRQFLTSLMNREARNYQFDFLRPQHSLFQYFTRLLEQYTKVLIPPKDLMSRLNDCSSRPSIILEQVKRRTDWQRHQEAQKRREEEELERERVSYAQIDWHDFVVVETVDYQPFEIGNFPPPTTPEEVGARILLQERYEEGQDVEMQLESDEEEDEDDEDEQGSIDDPGRSRVVMPPPPPGGPPPSAKDGPQQPVLAPTPENIIVRPYNPKAAPKPQARPPAPDEYLISPITGEQIPASQVAEHMRISLLDPRWVEQRDRQLQEKMTQESVYAPGSAIESSLRHLAERRTDIFGVGDEETAIGKKIGEEEKRKDDKVQWEGNQSTAEGSARQNRPPVSLQEQIAQIHNKNKALIDDRMGSKGEEDNAGVVVAAPPKPPGQPPVPPTSLMNIPRPMGNQTVILSAPQPPLMMTMQQQQMIVTPTGPPFGSSVGQFGQLGGQLGGQHGGQLGMMPLKHMGNVEVMEEEPPSKRARNEDQLMPEEAFLVRYPGFLSFHVAVPSSTEKPEWKLNGQQLSFSMLPTESIAAVKTKIHESTGMPPAKQKLAWEGLYFKDTNSLAFYNVTPDAVIQLQVKERGGRKK